MIANKIKTLIFPVLNVILPVFLAAMLSGDSYTFLDFATTFLLGSLLSGILPLVLIFFFIFERRSFGNTKHLRLEYKAELLVVCLTNPLLLYLGVMLDSGRAIAAAPWFQ